ncbi:MAG: LysM peptidoglycan-binding domain-containing protein, partial [Gammaproteobacteria bacterium]|nr:LysM peptidoglycan-binding domain-containing protein [Gammaproteobacteria bacterium]
MESALNQPFSAEIPFESYEQDDLKSLQVGLASADTFERYGLDLPVWMQDFEFAVNTADGVPVVSITSARPVAEPFVTLLLDIKWSSGRLLREYTVLLDPPLFEPAPVQATVTPAETAPAQSVVSSESAGVVTRSPAPPAPSPAPQQPVVQQPTPVPTPEPAPAPAPSRPVAEPAPQPVVAEAPVASLSGTSYSVQRRDTLWGIADRVRANSDVTVNQTMLALYRANPEAFLGNINRLKAGAILRIPDSPELTALSPAEATAQVREQNAALMGSRGSSASASTAAATAAEPAQLTLVPPATDTAEDSSSSAGASSADQA